MSTINSTVSIAELDSEKAHLFSTILMTLLSSPHAGDTFAQVIDGIPTVSGCVIPVMSPNRNASTEQVQNRHQPNPASIQLFRDFKQNLRPTDLRIDAMTAQDFQNSSTSSDEFDLHLLRIIAVAIHTLAVRIFSEFHPTLSYPRADHDWEESPIVQPSLYHPWYQIDPKYPNGRADVVGYWTESQIFGGVVLFDHDINVNKLLAAYINAPEGSNVFELSPTQVRRFREIGTAAKTSDAVTCIPFLSEGNSRQVRKIEAFALRIYRNTYEKRMEVPPRQRHVRKADPLFMAAFYEKFPDRIPPPKK